MLLVRFIYLSFLFSSKFAKFVLSYDLFCLPFLRRFVMHIAFVQMCSTNTFLSSISTVTMKIL